MNIVNRTPLKIQVGDKIKRLVAKDYQGIEDLRYTIETSFKELSNTEYIITYCPEENQWMYIFDDADLIHLRALAQMKKEKTFKLVISKAEDLRNSADFPRPSESDANFNSCVNEVNEYLERERLKLLEKNLDEQVDQEIENAIKLKLQSGLELDVKLDTSSDFSRDSEDIVPQQEKKEETDNPQEKVGESKLTEIEEDIQVIESSYSDDFSLSVSQRIVKEEPGRKVPELDLGKLLEINQEEEDLEEKEPDKIVFESVLPCLDEEPEKPHWGKSAIFNALLKLQGKIGQILLTHFSDLSNVRKDEELPNLLASLDISEGDAEMEGILKLLLGPPKEEKKESEEQVIKIFDPPALKILEQENQPEIKKIFKELPGDKMPKESQKLKMQEITEEPIAYKVHWGISCDLCGDDDIEGTRYKCLECDNFNICQTCKRCNYHSYHKHLEIKEMVDDEKSLKPFEFHPKVETKIPKDDEVIDVFDLDGSSVLDELPTVEPLKNAEEEKEYVESCMPRLFGNELKNYEENLGANSEKFQVNLINNPIVTMEGDIAFVEVQVTNKFGKPIILNSILMYNQNTGDMFDNYECEIEISDKVQDQHLCIPVQIPKAPEFFPTSLVFFSKEMGILKENFMVVFRVK